MEGKEDEDETTSFKLDKYIIVPSELASNIYIPALA